MLSFTSLNISNLDCIPGPSLDEAADTFEELELVEIWRGVDGLDGAGDGGVLDGWGCDGEAGGLDGLGGAGDDGVLDGWGRDGEAGGLDGLIGDVSAGGANG